MKRSVLWLAVPMMIVSLCVPNAIFASLIGDTVTASIFAPTLNIPALDPTDATVADPGIEYDSLGTFGLFSIDFFGDSFVLEVDLAGSFLPSIGDSLRWTLSDLDWVSNPAGIITGVTHTGGTGSAPLNISFTDHSIEILTPNESKPPDTFTYNFDIQTSDTAPIPEPSSYLLFAIGILGTFGLGYRRRRKTA